MWSDILLTLDPRAETDKALRAEAEREARRRNTPVLRRATPFTRLARRLKGLIRHG